jgi:endonuclease/exonuclease/phosphatase family metal-dependent hydrolase
MEVQESGTFWLSDTPETPGSMTWRNKCPRICTWAKVRWKATGRSLLLANTHWDNASEKARVKSAALMAERLPKLAGKLPLILTGDFNCQADSPALSALISQLKFTDTFAAAHPKADPKTSGTMHWFKGNQDGPRSDYILSSPEWKTTSASILNTRTTKLWPSDHYPVNWTGVLK